MPVPKRQARILRARRSIARLLPDLADPTFGEQMSDLVIEARDVALDGASYRVAVSMNGAAYVPRWTCKICDSDALRDESRCDTCELAISAAMFAVFRHHDERHKGLA
jgi:hypothetical protein